MRTLRKINMVVAAVVLLLVSGCASTHATKTAATKTGQTGIDTVANAQGNGFRGPESCIHPSDNKKTNWWDIAEYAFLPVTVGCRALLWYGDLPGVGR
jgi:hypothetical protein